MLVLACGRGGRVALVHAVQRSCRGAELRGGSGRAGLIDQASVRVIVGEPPRAVEEREAAIRIVVNAHGGMRPRSFGRCARAWALSRSARFWVRVCTSSWTWFSVG